MLAAALCALTFVAAVAAGRRSLTAGLTVVLAVGYAYGIVRANVLQPLSHFTFDAAVLGLYGAQLFRRATDQDRQRFRQLVVWVIVLVAWPLVLLALPRQDTLIQLVGLRGNIFLLPFLVLGARLDDDTLDGLAISCAVLNLVAFGFAAVEFSVGLEPFFPHSSVTEIMYRSHDVLGNTGFRIPSTFTSAHAYGGTMVVTLPFLIGAWNKPAKQAWHKPLLTCAITASMLGVFMAAARSHMLVLLLLVVVTTFSGRVRFGVRVAWVATIVGLGWVIGGQERLQRFTTLGDTDYVAERVAGSVNSNFFDLAFTYPLGNGLGGGGTSIPYFLQDRLQNPVLMENEYARIMLEQGVPGLLLWVAFIAWALTRAVNGGRTAWFVGRRLAWWACLAYFATGLIGTGTLTSIPQTALLLLCMGWVAVRPRMLRRGARSIISTGAQPARLVRAV